MLDLQFCGSGHQNRHVILADKKTNMFKTPDPSAKRGEIHV